MLMTPNSETNVPPSADDSGPTCDKCGAPVTTGFMAAFCPAEKECEFWVPGMEEFKKDWGIKTGTAAKTGVQDE